MYAKYKNLYRFSAVPAALLWASGAFAHNLFIGPHVFIGPHIVGSYGMTSTQSCVRTPFVQPPIKGFDENTNTLLLEGESVSALGSGVMQFNPDGTVRVTGGRFTEILNDKTNPGDVPVSALTEYGCEGKYQRLPQQKIKIKLECTVKSQGPGVVVNIKPFNFEGYIASNNQTMQMNLIDGAIQTIEVRVNGQVVQQRERICVQNASLSRL